MNRKFAKIKIFLKNLLKDLIWSPLKYAIASVIFLLIMFSVLHIFLPKLQLYMSLRDSIVEFCKNIHLVINKENTLSLFIGHSDSQQGLAADNYEINLSAEKSYVTVWFAILNNKEDEIYKNVRLFITFTDDSKKVDGEDGGSNGWVKFKENNFNYGIIKEILQKFICQTNSIKLKFPAEGIYEFSYTIHADGYKPTSGVKRLIVRKR